MNKKNRIIILLLLFIYFLNFTIQPKANAEAIAISSGLVLFLKACYAAGITYIGGQAVSKLTDDSVELYKEWQKFLDRQPPEKKPPTDWEKTAVGTMLGLQLGDSFKRLVDSVKDFFNDLGAKEGDNQYDIGDDVYVNPNTDFFSTYNVDSNYFQKNIYSGQNKIIVIVGSYSNPPTWFSSYIFVNGKNFGVTDIYTEDNLPIKSVNISIVGNTVSASWINRTGSTKTIGTATLDNSYDKPIPPSKTVNYFFEPNSYQFTNNPDDIRPVYPNIANLPDGKVVQVTNPDGSTTTYYKGTFDDLFNDWIATQDPNNIFGDTPLNLTETEQGIKLYDNSDEMPYPKPEPQPEPDTAKGIGEIISLLKQILNWNKNIHDKIGQTPEEKPTPEPEPQPNPMELPEKVELDFSPLQGLVITERFPFCLPWDLKRSIEKLLSPGEPPLWEFEILKNKIVIDFSQFESLASISRGFFSIIFTISLVVITRRFISGA